MTPFATLLAASGLSYREVGATLVTSKETVRDWARGKSRTPDEALYWAHGLVRAMQARADALVSALDDLENSQGLPTTIEIAHSTNDHEARANGFVSANHERACIGLALARLPPEHLRAVRLVARGSTVAVATAEAERLNSSPETNED